MSAPRAFAVSIAVVVGGLVTLAPLLLMAFVAWLVLR